MLIAFNKPFGVLSQFTPDGSPNRTLADFSFPKNVYPLGRLDADSEGLLLLSAGPRHRDAHARGVVLNEGDQVVDETAVRFDAHRRVR